jgi:hypothetical protein
MDARKPVLPVIAVCCALAGWFAWSAMPALAVAPETPEVSVEALVPPTTAVVHGVLNPGVEGAPGAFELGTYEFLYKQGKTGCEGESKAPASPGISLGGGKEAVTETLQGLSPDTEYTVCLLIRNGIKGEQAVSAPATFTTSSSLEAPVTKEPASTATATTVTFEGELNPGGVTGALSYQLDYNTNGTCKVVKASPEEPPFQQSTTPVEVSEAKQLSVHGVEATELEPNETYTFCLVATNVFGEQAQGNEVSLQTEHQAPTITGVSVANATSTGAMVSAEIYPHGEVTTYRVEYGPTNTYGSSTPEASISEQHGPANIQAQLTGLTPSNEYHYRIVTTNSTGSDQSPDATFTTSETAIAGSQGLPDNRTYEMVTPPENENADVYVPESLPTTYTENVEGIPTRRLFQVSADGSAVAYEGEPTSGGGNGEDGNGLGNQFLAQRLASGWVTRSIQPAGVHSTYYQGFSSDLSAGIITSGTPAEPKISLSPEALGEGYSVLYERVTNGDVYQPVFTDDVHPNRSSEAGGFGTDSGVAIRGGAVGRAPVFAGWSSDYSNILFEANDALLAGNGALETELENDVKQEIAQEFTEGHEQQDTYLYDSVGGKLSLVDVSPEGRVVPGATVGTPPINQAYNNDPNLRDAISADGKRVYWSSIETLYGIGGRVVEERPIRIYLRENPGEPQSPIVNGKCSVLSDACTVVVSEGEARYWASVEDGRYAFYTEDGELYRFDVEPEAGSVSREALAGGGAGVVGVLGVSEDGEDVYFAAKGALAPGATAQTCETGTGCNLYLLDKSQTRFVARLSGGDGNEVPLGGGGEPVESGDWIGGLAKTRSFVTSDGRSLVFMSSESLSVTGYPDGYPNNGAEEVYVYEAGSNSLFCASCGSTRKGASGYLPVSWSDTSLPQLISEDGDRVFFDSSSSLVGQATNGKQNVYEWEHEGSGTCTTGSAVHGGCVYLLSGGSSVSASWLVGASESGNDVFLVTRAQLAPEDQNEAFDLYDVRVDGAKPVSSPQCTGTGCQGVPAPPPTFATPSSVTFEGVGNFTAPTVTVVKAKAKSLSRAQKLTGALKACRKKPKRKRAICEAKARKQYGSSKNAHKSSGIAAKGRK